jgi:hypothetical protein
LPLVSLTADAATSTINSRISRDGEIVGIEGEEGGRSCERHDVCGNHLAVGDLVKFKVMMSLVVEEEEVVIKVIKIRDGNETCLAGFLPRHIDYGSRKDKLRNKYAQVLEIYKESADLIKKMKKIAAFLAWLRIASWTISRTWNSVSFIIVLYFSFVHNIESTLSLFIIWKEV